MQIEINQTAILLIQGDITRQSTNAIVNAANSSLMGGGGVDGAIHQAGGPDILKECELIVKHRGKLPAGKAVATNAGNLNAKYVIHTVGPVWINGGEGEPDLLASAYRESLILAERLEIKSISFPSISTGAYRYPLDQAAKIAINTVAEFAREEAQSLKEIVFVLFNEKAYEAYKNALSNVRV